jgi:hypothetical protein
MKNGKIFNYIVTLILLPLWLDFVKDLIKQIPLLHWTVIVILTLLMLFYFALTINELRIKLDSHFNFQRRRMDRLVLRTRKNLQKTITGTGDASVRDYAFIKLKEICSLEIYSSILTDMAEKEKRPVIKEILLLRAKNQEERYEEQNNESRAGRMRSAGNRKLRDNV